MKQNNFNTLIARTVGSKAALCRAMKKSRTPINYRTVYNWCIDARTIKLEQLQTLSEVMNVPLCELIQIGRAHV